MNLSAGGGPGPAAAAAGGAGDGPQRALFSAEDLACPICVETIEDAFATPCGHTFCFKCISTHLKNKSTCPSCGAHLVQDQIHPNFLLSKLIQRAATAQQHQSLKTALLQHVQHDLAVAGPSIGLQELDAAIQLLQDKRQQVATHESSNKLQLLMLFLQHAKARQLGQLSDLEQQLDVLQQDLAKARAAAAAAAAANGNPDLQQQQQQVFQASAQANGLLSLPVPAASSRPLTPMQQPAADDAGASMTAAAAAAAAAAGGGGSSAGGLPGSSLVGGRGSAFKRLQPAVAAAGGVQQQQPAEPAAQQGPQQQQQGFRPLSGVQPPQPQQQGFRPLPRPQQQQQQQQTAAPVQGGFKPFTPGPGPQQQQQQAGQLPPPLPQQQQGVGSSPSPLGVSRQGSQGFRPFGTPSSVVPAPAVAAGGSAAAAGASSTPAAASQGQQQQQQGFRPLQSNQAAGLRPLPAAQADGTQKQQQGFRPLSTTLQGPGQQQQQQPQQGFRALPPGQGPAAVQGGLNPGAGDVEAALNPEKKRKILEQFDELQQAYLDSRIRRLSAGGGPAPAPAAAAAAAGGNAGGFEQQQKQQQQQQQQALLHGGGQSIHANLQASGQQGQGRPGVLDTNAAVAAAAAGGGGAADDCLTPSSGVPRPTAASAAAAAAAAAADGIAAAAAAGGNAAAAAAAAEAAGAGGEDVLDAFSRMLYAVTHYSRLQPLAYVPSAASRAAGGSTGAQILSSVDFDCAGQLFAAAGVQQHILVHDFQSVLTHGGPQQQPAAAAAAGGGSGAGSGGGAGASDAALLQPLLDLPCASKISCVNFSPAVQQYLLSSDYAGVVQLWDLTGGRTVRQWEAHDKRIWAVDFCPLDATTFATGSDDGTVKVWGLCEAPVPRLTLPVRANVCSIKFSPAAPHMLAAGNAGHQVHLFDLRAPRAPLAVLKGHSKAVSYVRWAGPDTLVTASTDSTLRLWTASGGRGSSDTGGAGHQQQQQQGAAAAAAGGAGSGWECEAGGWHCGQVFKGHANSKHFVGLATQGPFIACGSETNEVFMYHQGLAQPSLKCLLTPWEGASSSAGGSAGAGGRAGAAAEAAGAQGGGGGAAAAAAAADGGAAAAGSAAVKSPFVSALCWRKDSDVLVAANSKGGVWVLSMQ